MTVNFRFLGSDSFSFYVKNTNNNNVNNISKTSWMCMSYRLVIWKISIQHSSEKINFFLSYHLLSFQCWKHATFFSFLFVLLTTSVFWLKWKQIDYFVIYNHYLHLKFLSNSSNFWLAFSFGFFFKEACFFFVWVE